MTKQVGENLVVAAREEDLVTTTGALVHNNIGQKIGDDGDDVT